MNVRVEDRTKNVCQQCFTEVRYVGNTSSMLTHIKQHHPDRSFNGARKKTSLVQQLIPAAFKPPLDINTDRAKNITEPIGIHINICAPICHSRGARLQGFIKGA